MGTKRKAAKRRKPPPRKRAAPPAETPLDAPNEFDAWHAQLTTREQRIDEIASYMAQGRWMGGVSYRLLARQWGVSPYTVEDMATEANRVIRASFRQDAEGRKDAVAMTLQTFEAIRTKAMLDATPAGLRVALEATKALGLYMGIEPPRNVRVEAQAEVTGLPRADYSRLSPQERVQYAALLLKVDYA